MSEELRDMKVAELAPPSVGRTAPATREYPQEPAEEYRSGDSSNSVWVTVDKQGRVLRVEVSTGWHTRLPAGEFSSALLSAYLGASETAAVVESRDRRQNPGPVPDEAPGEVLGLDEWVRSMQNRHAEIGRKLREAEARAEGRSTEVADVRSPYGYLALQVRAGALLGLTVDAARIAQVHGGQLQQDLWDGFRAAGLTSPNAFQEAPAQPPAARPRRSDPDDDGDEMWQGIKWQ
ncbi:hypothetical protein JOF53_003613 [Crossiella equi]|uniref:YbaB/EbfC DNA-binding family protein n=1 Tax=Crossiella equi TaxID=130796 RepID=A0ABS5AEI7_9PSEU|nr:hypothetical protein [Crossiella equi]MBP2474741.1 hypothetical protein [Crossiella equi]